MQMKIVIVNPGEGIFTVRACDFLRIAAAISARGFALAAAGPGLWIVKGAPSSGARHTGAAGAVPARRAPIH